ncbi:MAG: ABC transporter permease [Inquilinaceae bacterium]
MLELLSFGDAGWGDEMLRGAMVTVIVAVLSFALGIGIGIGGAAAKLSASRWLRGAADVYTTVVRGVPELLVIYLLFFGSTAAILTVARSFGYAGYVEVSPFLIGTVAVGLISGAYSTEVIRGAVQAIPAGQIEAGKACGMGRWLVIRRIVAPQAARLALPGLGNVWQLTLKDTALISVTSLGELMRMASIASGSTRQPFTFYVTAAVLYLAMTTVSTVMFDRGERHFSRGIRRA